MRVHVAGPVLCPGYAENVMKRVLESGHEVVVNWTVFLVETSDTVRFVFDAIATADAIFVVAERHRLHEGIAMEIGAGLAKGATIFMIGEELMTKHPYMKHPNVRFVNNVDAAILELNVMEKITAMERR